jgi:hypothetical protein
VIEMLYLDCADSGCVQVIFILPSGKVEGN